MPAYEYELIHEETGKQVAAVTVVLPVDARDGIVLRRRSVPQRVIVTGHARNEIQEKASALTGYRKLEEKLGSRFRSKFTAEQIKAAHATSPSPG